MSIRTVVAVAIVACLVFMIVSHVPVDRSAGIAWADVKDRIEKSRTIQFVSTEYPPGDRTNARKVSRTMIRGRYLKRDEIDDEVSKKSWIEIVDAKRGRRVMIEPESKLFIVFKTLVTVEVEIGKEVDLENANKQESEIPPQPKVDFYKSFMEMILPSAKTATERLPEKTIDDKKAVGFRSVEKYFQGQLTMTRTFWIDPKTKLPIRIEGRSRNKENPMGGSDWVMSDFIFDEKLDDSLFSFEPPDGYTVEERKLYHAKPLKTD